MGVLLVAAMAFIFFLQAAAGFDLEFSWWKELGQPPTFWRMLEIQWLPQAAAGAEIVAFMESPDQRELIGSAR